MEPRTLLLRRTFRRPAGSLLRVSFLWALVAGGIVLLLDWQQTEALTFSDAAVVTAVATFLVGIGGAVMIARLAILRDNSDESALSLTAQLDALVRHAPVPLLVINQLEIIQMASEDMEKFAGMPSVDLVGSPLRDLLPAGANSTSMIAADGSGHPIEVTASTLPPETPIGTALLVLRSVPERVGDDRALRDAFTHLQEAEQLRATFMTTVSHELRTPLTVIGGFANLLRNRWADLTDDQRNDALERLERNTVGLRALIDELLDFARFAAEPKPLRHQTRRLGTFVTAVAAELGGQLRGHRVHVVGEDVEAPIDPELTTRVVSNLLTNAARYSPEDAPITVRLAKEHDRLVIHVEDRGPGVAPEDRQRIFEPFWRAGDDVTLSTKGTGIGLAIVAELLQRAHGTIQVSEAPGGGARFEVRLPLVVPVAAEKTFEVDLRDGVAPQATPLVTDGS